MEREQHIEEVLEAALSPRAMAACPPRLLEAVRYAVFPGGARIRPRLGLAVWRACDGDDVALGAAATGAVELLHCASLVHDDLPCFDGAATRRGKPSVHVAYGEATALLVGDALIVRAFQLLAEAGATQPGRLAPLVAVIGGGVGLPAGIVAGQAWECEPSVPLARYQQAKTGALFAAATMAGAAAAGADPAPWRALGAQIGAAYQVADDILDATADSEAIGKPVGRDAALDRPSAVREFGLDACGQRLRSLVDAAADTIPPCPGEDRLREDIHVASEQFVQLALRRRAAA